MVASDIDILEVAMGCAGPEARARVRKDLENPESKASKTLRALLSDAEARVAGVWKARPLPDFESEVFDSDPTLDGVTSSQPVQPEDRATPTPRAHRYTTRILQTAATLAVVGIIGYGAVAYARMISTLSEREGQLAQATKTLSEHETQLAQARKDLTRTAEQTITELRGLQTILKDCDRLLKDRDPADPLRSEIKKLIVAVQMESTKLSANALRTPVFTGDKSTWLQDLGVQDDTEVRAGQAVTRIWKIKNIGTVHWKNRFLQREDDRQVPGRLKSELRVPIPDTPPGIECDIRVDCVAPEEPGVVYSEWKMVDPDGNYLLPSQTPLYIRLKVLGKK